MAKFFYCVFVLAFFFLFLSFSTWANENKQAVVVYPQLGGLSGKICQLSDEAARKQAVFQLATERGISVGDVEEVVGIWLRACEEQQSSSLVVGLAGEIRELVAATTADFFVQRTAYDRLLSLNSANSPSMIEVSRLQQKLGLLSVFTSDLITRWNLYSRICSPHKECDVELVEAIITLKHAVTQLVASADKK